MIDDSRTLIFNPLGWLSHRTAYKVRSIDLYTTLDGINQCLIGFFPHFSFDQESRIATVGVESLPANTTESYDVYYFAYGMDYRRCLQDFALLSGSVPMLPQYAFGLTWSKYWPYVRAHLSLCAFPSVATWGGLFGSMKTRT